MMKTIVMIKRKLLWRNKGKGYDIKFNLEKTKLKLEHQPLVSDTSKYIEKRKYFWAKQ